jgi:hypothetical protein
MSASYRLWFAALIGLFVYTPHIGSVVRKTSRSAALLLSAFSTRTEKFLMRLFRAYVRLTLEYASLVWSPIAVRLSHDLENVLHYFTKRLRGLRGMSYEQRLSHLQLESLEARRKQADLLFMFKFMRGHGYASIPRSWESSYAQRLIVPTLSTSTLIVCELQIIGFSY